MALILLRFGEIWGKIAEIYLQSALRVIGKSINRNNFPLKRIESMEAEQEALNAEVSHPDFYKETAENIRKALARLEELQGEVADAYARWTELDSRLR